MGPTVGSYIRRQMPQVPMVYYAPQMWVWWSNRRDIARIVEITDKLLAVFPEEARYFRAQGQS